MKRNFFVFLFLAVGLMSCKENHEVTEPGIYPEDGLITMTRTIDLGVETRAGGVASVSVVFNTNTEQIVSYTASPALLEAVQMTDLELDNYLREEMGPAYYLVPDVARGEFSKCYENCYQTKKKGDGRGNCRLACWMDLFERTMQRVELTINIGGK